MTRTFTFFTALLLASLTVACADVGLVVYPPVPGLAASEHYTVRVRAAYSGIRLARPTAASFIHHEKLS